MRLCLTHHVNELGHTNWFVHEAAGRLLYQTNANQELLSFTYNPANQLLTLNDGKGQTTKWNYDVFGRVTNKVDAANTEIFRYKYDPDNRLTNRWTLAKGDTIYRYDPIGNLTNVDYPGAIMDIALQYDPLNRLTNVVDAVGTTKFTYTAAEQAAECYAQAAKLAPATRAYRLLLADVRNTLYRMSSGPTAHSPFPTTELGDSKQTAGTQD